MASYFICACLLWLMINAPVKPVKSAPTVAGVCPSLPIAAECPPDPYHECRSDNDCRLLTGYQGYHALKCCLDGCDNRCIPPIPATPATTPPTTAPTTTPITNTASPTTPTTTTAPPTVAASGAMDVGILLDSSEDVSPENWQRIIAFVRAFVGRFTKVSPAADGTRFGLITYASNPAIHFNFSTLQGARLNGGEVQTLVSQTPRRPGTNRRIDAALQLAEQQLYSNRGGARQGAKKYMLLVMTGPQATDRPYTSPSTVAQRLQRGGVRIYPVAVGGRVNQAEVLSFTPHADDVTYVSSYPQLNTAAATIAPAVAEGRPRYIDLMFVVDSTQGVNFSQMKSFNKWFLKYFDISLRGTHVAYVVFGSSSATLKFSFPIRAPANYPYSVETVRREIDQKMTPEGGNRGHLHLGLEIAEIAFEEDNGGRVDARKVVVILSGAQWSEFLGPYKRYAAALRLRHQNANIYVIQVGRTVNRSYLLAVAGRPQNVFYSDTYERLQEIGKPLVESVVFGAVQRPPTTAPATKASMSTTEAPLRPIAAGIHGQVSG